jgi:Rad3-related DNA helicase
LLAAIGSLVRGRRGNYLACFPSYQYLNSVLVEFQARHPSIKVLAQQPGMSEPERDAFLEAFPAESAETRVGFAVLGGIFGEGIDLVGERLVGAVIVGVGLPQLCIERDLIRDYFQSQNGAGFDYAYTFPGMNRVVAACFGLVAPHIYRKPGRCRRSWMAFGNSGIEGTRAAFRVFTACPSSWRRSPAYDDVSNG